MINLFGNICADNFFDNPHQIINISKKIELKKTKTISGYRSENISDINKNLFDYVNKKIINYIYPGSKGIDFSASTFFQKSDADENDGWVHADNSIITGIIYLTPEGTSGTSIFDAKEEFNLPQPLLSKYEYFENKEKYTKEEKKLIYNEKLNNNDYFIKTINYLGKFNRMVAFDSKTYHAAEVCNKERLIIITFINFLNTNVYPVTFKALK
jgi:hypothetical protein